MFVISGEEMTKPHNLVGQTFGRLYVLALSEPVGFAKKRRAYTCICSCGNSKVIRSECLINGMTKSCGCLRNETTASINRKHSMSSTAEYKAWAKAKSRILNPKDRKYKDYGLRGISMSEDWINSFECFYKDMGKKPSHKHSIGRIDVNGDYCKENCRWETSAQQSRERTDNVFVFVDGKKMILKDACLARGINYKMASHKIKNGIWLAEDIFK
jgi:hypothetical protein